MEEKKGVIVTTCCVIDHFYFCNQNDLLITHNGSAFKQCLVFDILKETFKSLGVFKSSNNT